MRYAAADIFYNGAERGAHGNFDKTGIDYLAAQREHLGALALFGTHRREPVGAFKYDLSDVGVSFDVIENGGLAEKSFVRGERRTGTRLAALAFDTGHERRFLAAYERAGAETYFEVEVKSRSEYVLAEQSVFLSLLDGNANSAYRDRIFRADIYEALTGADRVRRYSHGFDDRVRVAFEYRPVHERAGVAFVGVAAYVFDARFVRFGVTAELPFKSRGEARAASAAQSARLDNVDNLLRLHLGQYLDERLIAVVRYVFVDILGVDDAAVTERDARLFFIEIGLGKRLRHLLGLMVSVQQSAYETTFDKMLLDEFLDVFHFHGAVESAFGINDDDGAHRAKSEAAGLDQHNFVGKVIGGKLRYEFVVYLSAVIGVASGAAANQYCASIHFSSSSLTPRRSDNRCRPVRLRYDGL